ncbi:DUF1206 domain-containing protein [Sphingomonas piscis]|uniref:DUF1206 domain-containing protein n=1 Tax=Sphingomonas piscis TaxID=2714943 RepID=A0A6G7YNT7_9SPHN|nr:DUF1206 domain-containing protein [Sphingomonas piscis]QIK78401.1 DUF1206 domain-containing protein [Sphingomonas piscis]
MKALAAAGLPDDLARESKFQNLTRVGFLARGLLYILIAWLVIRTGRTEDLTGALEYVGNGSGRMLLVVIAAGLAAYSLWRFADAALGLENPGSDGKSLRKRAAAGVVGIIYLFMAYKAVRVLVAGHADAMTPQQQADHVLDFPGGAWVLGLAAAVLIVAGLNQLHKTVKCSFMKPLDSDAISPVVRWLGRLGYAARGVIFLIAGWRIGHAALNHDSREAAGLEQALDFLDGPALYAVAGGLALFGAFSIVEARYRRIHHPPVDSITDKVRDKVGG